MTDASCAALACADECSVDFDPNRTLCHYYEYKRQLIVPFPQYVNVGKCIK